ncbi:MAG: hypothetical protein HFE73_01495 [Firmicutes bacterium]|nr:hypothetical protein [Bacillota bacterium]
MDPDMALKRWKFFRVFWPILCLGFAGFSLYQALIGVEKRFASDAGFILVPLVFLIIGMNARGKMLKEQNEADTLTIATVISAGEQVELYYARQNTYVFYVPAMLKHDRRVSGLLCGIGILFPLIGVFAPLIRPLFYFLG